MESCCPIPKQYNYEPCNNTVHYCGGFFESYRDEYNSCLESCEISRTVCKDDVLYKGCFCEPGMFKQNFMIKIDL